MTIREQVIDAPRALLATTGDAGPAQRAIPRRPRLVAVQPNASTAGGLGTRSSPCTRTAAGQPMTPHRQPEAGPIPICAVEPPGTALVGSFRQQGTLFQATPVHHLEMCTAPLPQHTPGAVREVKPSCR